MSDIVPRAETAPAKANQDGPPNALKQLPKEWRPLVSFFWAANEGLLKTPLELVTRLRFWMDPKESIGLTFEELKPILKVLLQPGVSAEFQFGSQVMAELSRRVSQVPAERRKKAAAAKPPSLPTTPEEHARMRQLMAVNARTQKLFAPE